jgi:hypothetical protein
MRANFLGTAKGASSRGSAGLYEAVEGETGSLIFVPVPDVRDLTPSAPRHAPPYAFAALGAVLIVSIGATLANLVIDAGAPQPEPPALAGTISPPPAKTLPVQIALEQAPATDPAALAEALPASPPQPATMPQVTLASAAPPTADERAAGPGSPRKSWAVSGTWAPSRRACSRGGADKLGLLVMKLDENGAYAGDTTCSFGNKQPNGSGWSVVARCARSAQRWTSRVRLAVEGDKLTWSSEKGSQAYVRCPGAVMASR